MSNLPEVPIDDLLSFHDYPTNETSSNDSKTFEDNKVNVSENKSSFNIEVPQEDNRDLNGGINFIIYIVLCVHYNIFRCAFSSLILELGILSAIFRCR